MDPDELYRRILNDIEAGGLGNCLVKDKSQLQEFPEEYFAEIVLNDAGKIDLAKEVLAKVAAELGAKHQKLDYIVRALWQVREVQKIEIPSPTGVPSEMVAVLFKGTLQSGRRCQEVWVAVTPAALGVLRPLVTKEQALLDLVRAFLLHRLSIGGAGYWDPIREPKRELDEDAARYLRWRPYEQLKRSVDLVFSSKDHARGFLRQPAGITEKRAHDFNHVRDRLLPPAGAIAPGERLPTSNDELYGMLLDSEKEELRQYYSQKLERACKDWPELKQEFQEY